MRKGCVLLFLLIAVAMPVAQAEDITLSLAQKDYYFKTGEYAVLKLKSENSYSQTIDGLLSYTITQQIKQGNFQYSSSSTRSAPFSVSEGESETPISFGSSDTPMTLSVDLKFSYTKDHGREVVLDNINIHFVSDESQKKNQRSQVKSSSSEAGSPKQQQNQFAQQEQRMQQMIDKMFANQKQQPQNQQQALQNNQMAQDSTALKQQMQKQVQKQQKLKKEFQKQLSQNPEFIIALADRSDRVGGCRAPTGKTNSVRRRQQGRVNRRRLYLGKLWWRCGVCERVHRHPQKRLSTVHDDHARGCRQSRLDSAGTCRPFTERGNKHLHLRRPVHRRPTTRRYGKTRKPNKRAGSLDGTRSRNGKADE